MRNRRITSGKTFVLTAIFVVTLVVMQLAGETQKARKLSYRGWSDSLVLSNGKVEAVVVPAVGRVMQFRFVGEDDIFWENASLQGKSANPASQEWNNFGGDKTWPSPQADWEN